VLCVAGLVIGIKLCIVRFDFFAGCWVLDATSSSVRVGFVFYSARFRIRVCWEETKKILGFGRRNLQMRMHTRVSSQFFWT